MVDEFRPDVAAATQAQWIAADPSGSRLASANAGSGKTKVLVDRVTRLLIGGASPDKILCLTYTKAAANEMQNRLFQTLGDWSVMGKDDLNKALNNLLGGQKNRDENGLRRFRSLFAEALETPEGLKVQTIHAFCERVLGRFPIEAGIQPGYDPIDEVDMATIRKSVETTIYQKAWGDPKSELAEAVRILASDRADQTLEKLMGWMASHVDEIKLWQEAGGLRNLAEALDIDVTANPETLKAQLWLDGPQDDIRTGAQSLMQSTNGNDRKKAEDILNLLTSEDAGKAFDDYAGIVLTAKKEIRAGLVTKSAPEQAQDYWGIRNQNVPDEPRRVLAAWHKVLGAQILKLTRAIYIIACEFAKGYEAEKRIRRGLDFNDQVLLVRDLLTRNEVAEWVLYKLDGGVEHILVDEAQDTAPSQWRIIDELKAGFEPADPDLFGQSIKTFFAVGDEKQSIYSFQGARPEEFVRRIDDLSKKEGAKSVRMEMSFRSAPDILRFVDGVFADAGGLGRMFGPSIVDKLNSEVKHAAFRQDGGLVELWPLSPKPEEAGEERAWDTKPVDAPSQASARERLAREIASKIKTWLDQREPVYDRELRLTRPMRADDILILVRSRNDFFDAVIRNLKSIGVAVAGADRLKLADSVVVKDLLALTRFVLLPSDDLSLAEVLRSPLIDLSEDQLFELCYDRGDKSLWENLKTHPQNFARRAAISLETMIGFSRQYAPFEFFRRVLDVMDSKGLSRLSTVYHRLGMEAQDALEAFLTRALGHQRQGAPSLQHFLKVMSSDQQDVKREMDNAQGEVRVMTVHGAKGLEAPVVILPDTTQLPKDRNFESLHGFKGGQVYIPSKASAPLDLAHIIEKARARDLQEQMRLLYVALTRAESRLLICGYHAGSGAEGMTKGCWYQEVSDAMGLLPHQVVETPFGDGKIFGQHPEPFTSDHLVDQRTPISFPEWVRSPAPDEKTIIRKVTPSHLLAGGEYAEAPVRSPLEQSVDRFQRGNLTHKLLEVLPDIEPNLRRGAAKVFLQQHQDISDNVRESIENEVMIVLEHPNYAPFFATGSQAEVNLAGQGAGLPDHLRLNAQIDRLAVTKTHVYIIDYKSNRPPPLYVEDVPEIYWGQMAAYREMIKLIYTDHEIVCALLWTDGPSLMILPDNGLDVVLTRLGSDPT